MKTLWQDLRYGLRSLLKSPGFTAVVVLSLALGIGSTTVMFSIVNGVLLRQLPYQQDDQLVSVVGKAEGIGESKIGLSQAEFLRLRQQSQSLGQSGAYYGGIFPGWISLGDVNNPRRFRTGTVTPDLFPMLGYQPILGRHFLPSDAPIPTPLQDPPTQGTIMLSYGLWQSGFGGDPNVVNTVINIGRRSFPRVIVGVMPRDFQMPVDLVNDEKMELWYPWNINEANPNWRGRGLSVVARLRPGKRLSDLQADLAVLAPRLRQERPEAFPAAMNWSLTGMSLQEDLVGDVRQTLLLLMCGAGMVLLIACVNVANLLLTRATARRREIALRATLGATRSRLIGQLFTEALLLAMAAAPAGLLLAHWGLRLMIAVTPVGALPRAAEVALDWRVLLFTVGISFLAALLFGLLPAMQASRLDLNTALREEGRSGMVGGARQRLRSVLVVGEVALAFMLVIGAGLLLRSYTKLLQTDPGFNPHNLLTARISLPSSSYPTNGDKMGYFSNFRRKMREIGATSATGADVIPLSGPTWDTMFEIEGRQALPLDAGADTSSFPHTNLRFVLPGYFETMEMRLLQGRFFAETEDEGGVPAGVVNETMARRFFPGEEATGKRVRLDFGGDRKTPWIEIVGVIADGKLTTLNEPPEPEILLAAGQNPTLAGNPNASIGPMSVLIRFSTPSLPTAAQFREVMKDLDPLLAIQAVEPMEDIVSRTLVRPRFNLIVLGVLAAGALLIAVVGVYGLISYSVTQRRHEIGIRMALGARRGSIVRLIVRQGSVLALIGVAIGLAASLALTRIIGSLLYGVTATDPATFVIVALLLTGAAVLASYIPARRAARVDPQLALRVE